MAKKLYVVCEYGWEYDDNYYYQSEDNGTSPLTAYRNKVNADADARQQNITSLRSHFDAGSNRGGIAEYAGEGGWESFVTEDKQEQLFRLFNEHDVLVTSKEYIEYTCPEDGLPDEFYEKLVDLTHIQWYCVNEVADAEDV